MLPRRSSFALVLLVSLIAGAAGAAGLPTVAAAHAVLERSDPAEDSSLTVSPERIVLTFSEAADPKLSLVRVVDARGRPVRDVAGPQVVSGDRESLEVLLGTPLADGVYTVNWRAVSNVDGHVQSGAFAFGVGQKPAPGAAFVVDLLHTSPWASALAGAGRWLLYAGLVVLIGGATTSLFVHGATLPPGGVLVLRWTVAVAIVGFACMVWSQKMLVGAPSLLPLFVMRQGKLLLALGGALAACAAVAALVDLWPARWTLWLLGAAGAAAAMLHVVAGHAAAPASLVVLNVAAQWVHLTAIGVWVGGLFWLLLGLRGRLAGERAPAVGVFTRLATVTLVVVLATGIARAVAEVGSVTALLDTDYGVTLLVKIALAAAVVCLGALNHLLWAPAVRAGAGERADRRFALNSRGELAVALAVLAATAVLTGLVPARSADATAADGRAPAAGVTATGSDYATSLRATLTVTPGVAGFNDYVCTIVDYDTGEPLATVAGVRLRCSLPARPSMAEVTVRLREAADGRWTGGGLDFSVAGRWKVDVSIQEESKGASVSLELTIVSAEAP